MRFLGTLFLPGINRLFYPVWLEGVVRPWLDLEGSVISRQEILAEISGAFEKSGSVIQLRGSLRTL